MSDANPMLYGGVGVCECHGQPVYVTPGGKRAGGSRCHVDKQAQDRRRAERRRHTPHSCEAKGCERPAAQSENGQYDAYCRECRAGRNARTVRMNVGYGMQIYVGLAPTPEIRAIIGKHTRTVARKGAA